MPFSLTTVYKNKADTMLGSLSILHTSGGVIGQNPTCQGLICKFSNGGPWEEGKSGGRLSLGKDLGER